MIIGVDLDGVVCNFVKAMNEATGLDPDYVPVRWDWKECLTDEQVDVAWDRIRAMENFWARLEPMPDAIKQLKAGMDMFPAADFYFVTSRIPTAGLSPLAQTTAWLRMHGLGSPAIVVQTSRRKYEVCKAIGIDYLIDDYHPTVRRCGAITMTYLLDRPYNRGAFDLNPFRVKSLEEFFEKIGLLVKNEIA